MKMILKSITASFILLILLTLLPFENECRVISDNVLRVHILANSDSFSDQQLKLKVRDAILSESEKLFSDVTSKVEAKQIVRENLDVFENIAQNVITTNGYDYQVSATVTNLCFNTREYGDVTMPAGFYDALQIRIGNAQGKNWWCVMYPSLCVPSASDCNSMDKKFTDNQYNIVSSGVKYDFRFRVVELFSSIVNFFS